ncbi:MAG: sulfotransferase, partial [Cyanobacteria bacterium J06649_11]
SFIPDMTKRNVSGLPRNRLIHTLFNRGNSVRTLLKSFVPEKIRKSVSKNIQAMNLKEKPKIRKEERDFLKKLYRDDISKLQALIDRDLSAWLN